jgi:hypothetical protein
MGLFGPKAETVFAKGSPQQATIVGIHFDQDKSDPPIMRHQFGLRLGDSRTVGVRQKLEPTDWLRLGMTVDVRVHGDAVVIDWGRTMGRIGREGDGYLHGWKMLKQAPSGICDDELGIKRKNATEGTFTCVSFGARRVLGIATVPTVDGVVELPGQPAYRATADLRTPGYAAHLPIEGGRLPCVVPDKRLDKPMIDWPAAAVADPGVGQPPAFERSAGGSEPAAPPDPLSELPVEDQIRHVAGKLELRGGISMATFVAVQVGMRSDRVKPAEYDNYAAKHGVIPGTWEVASNEWMKAVQSDWRVGAAYGEMVEAENKRRKGR